MLMLSISTLTSPSAIRFIADLLNLLRSSADVLLNSVTFAGSVFLRMEESVKSK